MLLLLTGCIEPDALAIASTDLHFPATKVLKKGFSMLRVSLGPFVGQRPRRRRRLAKIIEAFQVIAPFLSLLLFATVYSSLPLPCVSVLL